MSIHKILHFTFVFAACFLGSYHFSYGQGFSNQNISTGVNDTHDGSGVIDMFFGAGAAWFDYNKDGDIDLYVTARTGANKLYENNGDGTFTDVAAAMGVQDATGDGGGVAIADINNDGWDDLFLANNQGNKLFKNNSGTSFTDITNTAFADTTAGGLSKTVSASWGDYDKDGYLDLYISHHEPPAYNQSEGTRQDFLYHNNGNETFTDVSDLLGLAHLTSWGFIGGWTDYDKDGDLDIFLVNDCLNTPYGLPTKIFRNDGYNAGLGEWEFTEAGVASGVDDCRNGMGIAVGDYNRDGWMDVFYTNIGECVLFQNNNGVFADSSAAAGIDIQPVQDFSWGATFMDYDLDGWQDIFVSIGTLSPIHDSQPNNVFQNNGDGTFTDKAVALGLDDDRRTRSMLYGDYDNDGDMDIYMINYGQDCILFRNDNNNGNNWLKIKLEGSQSDKNGIGSKISLTTSDGVTQYYETRSGSNLSGGDSPYAHFGLDTNTIITQLRVEWLSGEVQIFNSVDTNQLLTVVEPLASLPVELTSFSARAEQDAVQLNWTTASETNNEYFMVQKSRDGVSFEDLEKVDGQGTTTQLSVYELMDNNPFHGDNYYRLKQVDYDGKFSYSEIELVTFLENEPTVSVFPNPAKEGIFNVNFYNQNRGTTLEVRDILGRLIYVKNIEELGSQNFEIETAQWDTGLYIVRVYNNLMDQKIKVVVDN